MAPARTLRVLLFAASAALALAGPAPIVAFNDEAQAAVRELGIQSQISSRIYAIVHTSQYLAISKQSSPALKVAQAAYGGHAALSQLFPWRFARLDKALKPFLAGLSDAQKASAQAAGSSAAFKVLKHIQTDGFARYVPFEPAPPNGPVGAYQFAPNQTYSVYPQIASTRPLVLKSIAEFKPAAPLSIPSPAYTTNLKEVFELGKKESVIRNSYQTDTAFFWADGPTTSSHAGHFNQIAQVLVPANYPTRATARLFALLNAATWDASLAAYKAKYDFRFWRPITAIRQGDDSAASAAYKDSEWTPLLSTPSHPEYPSGHSATAAASAAVIANVLGSKPFNIGTEYPGLPPRFYNSLQQAVEEIGLSRVYGGIHFRHAVVEGAKLGAKVAEAVIKKFDAKFK